MTDREFIEGLQVGSFGAHEELALPVIEKLVDAHLAGLDVTEAMVIAKEQGDYARAHHKDHTVSYKDFNIGDLSEVLEKLGKQMLEEGHIPEKDLIYWRD